MKGYKIVVLDRGWVFVGNVRVEPDTLVIEDASCIRYWGTTRGLGELAAHGPTKQTKLDPAGTVRVPVRAVLFTLDTEVTKWITS